MGLFLDSVSSFGLHVHVSIPLLVTHSLNYCIFTGTLKIR